MKSAPNCPLRCVFSTSKLESVGLCSTMRHCFSLTEHLNLMRRLRIHGPSSSSTLAPSLLCCRQRSHRPTRHFGQSCKSIMRRQSVTDFHLFSIMRCVQHVTAPPNHTILMYIKKKICVNTYMCTYMYICTNIYMYIYINILIDR